MANRRHRAQLVEVNVLEQLRDAFVHDAHRLLARAEGNQCAVVRAVGAAIAGHARRLRQQALLGAAVGTVIDAVDQHELAFDRLDDLRQRDFVRRARQAVAAAQSAHRVEHAGARELLQQVGHDGLVEAGLRADFLRADDRVLGAAAGEGPLPRDGAQQEDGVVGFLGDSQHRQTIARKVDLDWGSFNVRLKKALNVGTFGPKMPHAAEPGIDAMTDLPATLLANGPYGRAEAPYRLLSVRGPDASEFLQRLCSQDIARLPEGALAPAAFLDAKGKLQATALVFRFGDVCWLETHAEQADRLAVMLERYHFTERLAIEPAPPEGCREWVAVAGPGAERAEPAIGTASRDECTTTVELVRHGVKFVREHGVPTERTAAPSELTVAHAECVRMAAGFVRVGLETEASTLALEAALDDHCSTKKGCYTGQEIVARIHTYGHVNRKLCLLRLAPGDAIEQPRALHEVEDDLPVGRVMHAVPAPAGGDSPAALRIGLGYLPADFQAAGTKLRLAGTDASEGDVEVIAFA